MKDYLRHSLLILDVYLKRGVEVLSAIDEGDYDRVNGLLKKRGEAFYNFKATHALCEQTGVNVLDNDEAKALFCKIDDVNSRLYKELERLHESDKQELLKLRTSLQFTKKSRTGRKRSSSFEQAV